MKESLTIAYGVFLGLLLFVIFLWIVASIIWLVYGKRYFAPSQPCRNNTIVPYFTEDPQKSEVCYDKKCNECEK